MNLSLVVGLGYGDEGKGVTVNTLCKDPKNSLVVRFNGGHQCGHTVVHKGYRHVFSNFGSGTLKGVSTYWSEYCTVDPVGVLKEGNILREKGFNPVIYYDANAMVTTPYDIYKNVRDDNNILNGTVGVGFGATIQRNEDHYHLYMRDLLYPNIREEKLRLIKKYYGNDNRDMIQPMNMFITACNDLIKRYEIIEGFGSLLVHDPDHIIFEGGQGIMLDQNFGFFPHVTRSNTTSQNAIELIKKHRLQNHIITTYYVTRPYQTRHGNGYMSNEGLPIDYIKINPLETNVDTGKQGKFRRSVLDFDMIKYAISCDKKYNISYNDHLVMTCLDHVKELIPITETDTTGMRSLRELPAVIIAKYLNLKPMKIFSDTEIGEIISFTYKDREVIGEILEISGKTITLLLHTDYVGRNVEWYKGETKEFNRSEMK
jgi:adenylosuccinate synthase